MTLSDKYIYEYTGADAEERVKFLKELQSETRKYKNLSMFMQETPKTGGETRVNRGRYRGSDRSKSRSRKQRVMVRSPIRTRLRSRVEEFPLVQPKTLEYRARRNSYK